MIQFTKPNGVAFNRLATSCATNATLTIFLVVVGLASPGSAQSDESLPPEIIDMTPDQAVGWSFRNLAAPVSSVFQGGLGYWYAERTIEVDTTPSGGFVDLFYVRRNFQKRFEQAQAPVIIVLPPRIKAGQAKDGLPSSSGPSSWATWWLRKRE